MKINVHLFISTAALLVVFASPTAGNERSNAYWLWNGTIKKNFLQAKTVYAYQGKFDVKDGRLTYHFEGVAPRPASNFPPNLVPTYRLNRLVPPEMVISRFVAHRRAWERYGARVTGVQIDYDCATRRLPDYSNWLALFGKLLDRGIDLSITGLGDWLVSARDGDLRTLTGQVKFIAFMMYHNDRPLRNLEQYTKRLERFSTPFYLGRLSEQISYRAFTKVRGSVGYQGDIIFPHTMGKKP